MKSIELFSGAGGLALAIHLAGFENQLLVEVDVDACNTLLYNSRNEVIKGVSHWSVVNRRVEDIDFRNVGQIDLLAAGIPCQPFSNAGRRRGFEDERNMFPTFSKVLAAIKPKAFLLENVSGLINGRHASYLDYILLQLSHPWFRIRDGETWLEHLERLRSLIKLRNYRKARYDITSKVLNAADYGVPQIRRRVFIVGFRADLKVKWDFPIPTHSKEALLLNHDSGNSYSKKIGISETQILGVHEDKAWLTVRDALKGLPDIKTVDAKVIQHTLIPGARCYKGHTGSPLNWPAKSLKAGMHGIGGGENMLRYGNGKVRYFTVRECARLQTFPDAWAFKGTWSSITRQLGNAVPVKLATAVAKSVKEALENGR